MTDTLWEGRACPVGQWIWGDVRGALVLTAQKHFSIPAVTCFLYAYVCVSVTQSGFAGHVAWAESGLSRATEGEL